MPLRRMSMALVLAPFGLVPSLLGQGLGRIETDRQTTEEVEGRAPVVFEGIVVDAGGAPAAGAVVVSSAGGSAVTDRSGSYRLEASVPVDARSIQITAVAGSGESLAASTSVDLTAGSALARVAPLELGSGGACQPSWLPTFGGEPGTNDRVQAFAVFDDGGGPSLHAAGHFTSAGGVPANYVARWDGSSWSALGSGLNNGVEANALEVFDDGSGPALYVGGAFSTAGGVPARCVAKWNGSSWSALGNGLSSTVYALAAFDDGSGLALYAGGEFTTSGGAWMPNIARWNGSGWSGLGSGMGPAFGGSTVRALAVFDDGSGPALHAGGYFTTAGGAAASSIAKWDGSSWSPLGSGMGGSVHALATFDDGNGPALYAGGYFTSAGGVTANRIAKWNGSSWSPLGSGMNIDVIALRAFDDGSGPALYAGGLFTTAGGVAANRIARWDGSSWSSLGSGINLGTAGAVHTLTVFDDGNGPGLYAGGNFTTAGGAPANHLAKWDDPSWSPLGSGPLGNGMNAPVDSMTVFDDGNGPAVHVGGSFTSAGGQAASRIARWDGSSWSPLGSGMTSGSGSPPRVSALTVFDDGFGPELYAGGHFTTAGGVPANHLAKWDGTTWSPLGSGVSGLASPFVSALTVFDDGNGPAPHAACNFGSGLRWSSIAAWSGTKWVPLGSAMGGSVHALAVFDDGNGPALHAAGEFTTAGGVLANNIAKWVGTSWSPLGSGLSDSAWSLQVFDDGSGPALYVGGRFTTAGGAPASGIAKWDGANWFALGGGVSGYSVYALTVFDDGNGPALYAGGDFTIAGGTAANCIARWDGASWTALGSGTNGSVSALTVFNDRTGPALYAGGTFSSAPDSGDSFLAKWGCPDTDPPAIACPSPVKVLDRGAPGEIVAFTVTAADEEDPTPSLVCIPPSGSFFPRGKTTVTCTSTDFSGNQSTCQFTVTVHAKVREL